MPPQTSPLLREEIHGHLHEARGPRPSPRSFPPGLHRHLRRDPRAGPGTESWAHAHTPGLRRWGFGLRYWVGVGPSGPRRPEVDLGGATLGRRETARYANSLVPGPGNEEALRRDGGTLPSFYFSERHVTASVFGLALMIWYTPPSTCLLLLFR